MSSFIAWLNQQYEERGLLMWAAFVFELLAAASLFALMILTCADVVGRYFLNRPVPGATELTEMGLAVVVFSIMPIVTWRGGQIVVDLFDNILPHAMLRALIWLSTALIGTSLYFVALRVWQLGARNLKRGIVSDFLHIPTGYVIQYIAIFSWLTVIGLIIHTALGALFVRSTTTGSES